MSRPSSPPAASPAAVMTCGIFLKRCGCALWEAQKGGKAPWVKPLEGYGGAGVVEIVDGHDGDTHRAACTIRF